MMLAFQPTAVTFGNERTKIVKRNKKFTANHTNITNCKSEKTTNVRDVPLGTSQMTKEPSVNWLLLGWYHL